MLSPRHTCEASAAQTAAPLQPPLPGLAGPVRHQDETNGEQPRRSGSLAAVRPSRLQSRGTRAGGLLSVASSSERGFIKYAWPSPRYCAQGARGLTASCAQTLQFPWLQTRRVLPPAPPRRRPHCPFLPLPAPTQRLPTPSAVCKAGEGNIDPELILNQRSLGLEPGGHSVPGTAGPELRRGPGQDSAVAGEGQNPMRGRQGLAQAPVLPSVYLSPTPRTAVGRRKHSCQ